MKPRTARREASRLVEQDLDIEGHLVGQAVQLGEGDADRAEIGDLDHGGGREPHRRAPSGQKAVEGDVQGYRFGETDERDIARHRALVPRTSD